MRIAFLGDTHGNLGFVEKFYEYVVQFDVDVVFQVGDFGFWEHKAEGVRFLDGVNECAQRHNIPLYWIDGNHENFENLYEFYVKENWDEFIPIRDNIFYVPRGKTWDWDGVRFMGFGGAYSVDKTLRSPYISWWPQEMPTDEEVGRAVKAGKVDVLITHDVCHMSNIMIYISDRIVPGTEKSRKQLDIVAASAKPTHIVHGHYHFPYITYADGGWGTVKIVALDADVSAGSWGDVFTILDTTDFAPIA